MQLARFRKVELIHSKGLGGVSTTVFRYHRTLGEVQRLLPIPRMFHGLSVVSWFPFFCLVVLLTAFSCTVAKRDFSVRFSYVLTWSSVITLP